jgi:TonB family protein
MKSQGISARIFGLCVVTAFSMTASITSAQIPKIYLQMPNEMYPPEALSAKLEGNVQVTLVAATDGSAQCATKAPESLAILKKATCDILVRRITFSPSSSPTKTIALEARWKIWNPRPGVAPTPQRYGGAIPISPESWVFTDDYPSSELGGPGGKVTAAFDIGVDGRPANCTIAISSGARAFDDRTCAVIIRRARFIPAIDDSGRPRATSANHTIIWRP